jgi:hypothetical protein
MSCLQKSYDSRVRLVCFSVCSQMFWLECRVSLMSLAVRLWCAPQRRTGVETPPRSTKDVILLTIKLSIGDVLGPDMARRTKRKSDPGKVAPCKFWSGCQDLNLRPPAPEAGALQGCATFLYLTTSEKKSGFLLIETFRKLKLWPPGFVPWWPFLHCRCNRKGHHRCI